MENEGADVGRGDRTHLARPNAQARTGDRDDIMFLCSANHEQECLQLLLYQVAPICMVTHTYSKNMDQTGKVANLARGQLNKENSYFPVRVRA